MKWADKRNIIILHVSFWVLFFLFKVFDYANDIPAAMAVKLVVCQHVFSVVGAYAHYFWLLPLLFKRKKLPAYFLGLIVLFACCIAGRFLLESAFISGLFQTDYYSQWTFARGMSMVWTLASFIVFISLIKFTIDRFLFEAQKKEIENEKLNAELNYLKAQINPHFLFNTLHNLNYLAQAKRDETSQVIIKLSNIMRYMIYDAGGKEVALGQELDYINDYLDLEKIRLNRPFNLSFEVSADEQLLIAPLILFPFVENAFKHGISDREDNCWLKIEVTSNQNELVLKVKNSVLKTNGFNEKQSGLGLKNVERRLALMYPNKHVLNLTSGDDVFEVSLKIVHTE